MFKLMIVDDEMLMRIGIRSMIDWEDHGFRVVCEAADGMEALELALELKPDLIITDIKMPIMDGLQLIRESLKALPGCKFIVLSNFDEFRYAKEACQLGAIDYLIKSEITPTAMIELLAATRQKLLHEQSRSGLVSLLPDYSQSITHLKESLFKDLISGLAGEREAETKAQQLQVCVRSADLVLIKFHIDRFMEVRKKYVEKDEKLLRFSVVNIMGEIIPGKWNKEVVIESSSDYLLIVNTPGGTMAAVHTEIHKMCRDIQQTLKNFMNLSLSVGISSVVPGFQSLKTAYRQADQALRRKFFEGMGRLLYFENAPQKDREIQPVEPIADETLELAFLDVLESQHEANLAAFFEDYRKRLAAKSMNERNIREAYIRLTEIIGARLSYAHRPQAIKTDPSPYEAVLSADTWEDIHDIVHAYARQYIDAGNRPTEQQSYADLAARLIHRYYAEEISLQSVANQINVNSSYLSRVFKQEKGENFITYLTRIRIDRAKSFLECRKYKVHEVADKVGYHNYTYFSKIFKKVVGVSPEEYRCQQPSA